MTHEAPGAPTGSTLHPDSDQEALHAADEGFIAVRREFAIDCLRASAEQLGTTCVEDLTSGSAPALLQVLPDERSLLVDPVFTVWIRVLAQALGQRRSDLAAHHLRELPDVLACAWRRLAHRDAHYVGGTDIAVQRDEIHPYVMAVTPPSYDFTETRQPGAGHSVALEAELLTLALANIESAWPEERAEVVELIQIIGYLPNATFTSCSAARYAGVVYLGNCDESLLDLEESLVHEAGHQRLYRLGEVASLTLPGTPTTADFVLPWSSSERDLFGFLHACYIYVLLVKYFLRRRAIDASRAGHCQRRAELIFLGLLMAMPELSGAEHLSPAGQQIVSALDRDISALRAEIVA